MKDRKPAPIEEAALDIEERIEVIMPDEDFLNGKTLSEVKIDINNILFTMLPETATLREMEAVAIDVLDCLQEFKLNHQVRPSWK